MYPISSHESWLSYQQDLLAMTLERALILSASVICALFAGILLIIPCALVVKVKYGFNQKNRSRAALATGAEIHFVAVYLLAKYNFLTVSSFNYSNQRENDLAVM